MIRFNSVKKAEDFFDNIKTLKQLNIKSVEDIKNYPDLKSKIGKVTNGYEVLKIEPITALE